MPKKVLVLGLGNIGFGIAKNLHDAGVEVLGVDISKKCLQAFQSIGGKISDSLQTVISDYEVIIICLVNEEQIQNAFLKNTHLIATIKSNATIVVTSTVSVDFMRSFAQQCKEHNIHVLDAPVSGGTIGAMNGTLSVFASGTKKAFEATDDILKAFGKTIYHFGDEPGIGSMYKIIHQLLAGVHIVAAAEAFALAKKVGVDLKKFYDLVLHSAGNSWMFENRGPRMLEHEYEPKSQINIFVKDLGLVTNLAKDNNVTLKLAHEALKKFLEASEDGYGDKDDSAVIETYF